MPLRTFPMHILTDHHHTNRRQAVGRLDCRTDLLIILENSDSHFNGIAFAHIESVVSTIVADTAECIFDIGQCFDYRSGGGIDFDYLDVFPADIILYIEMRSAFMHDLIGIASKSCFVYDSSNLFGCEGDRFDSTIT